jgi:hypothetical protein
MIWLPVKSGNLAVYRGIFCNIQNRIACGRRAQLGADDALKPRDRNIQAAAVCSRSNLLDRTDSPLDPPKIDGVCAVATGDSVANGSFYVYAPPRVDGLAGRNANSSHRGKLATPKAKLYLHWFFARWMITFH